MLSSLPVAASPSSSTGTPETAFVATELVPIAYQTNHFDLVSFLIEVLLHVVSPLGVPFPLFAQNEVFVLLQRIQGTSLLCF